MDDFYSKASRDLQGLHDSRRLADQLEQTRLHRELTDEDRYVIEKAEFFFLATANSNEMPDCSIKGGIPGFISIDNAQHLSFSDYDGNGMFRSLGNIEENPNVGLLFLCIDGDLRKLRINGSAKVIRSTDHQSGHSKLKVQIEIREIFPNCPRYIPQIKIEKSSIYNPADGYEPPDPHWKSKPDLKPYLPSDS